MTAVILGVDASLTGTGVARIDPDAMSAESWCALTSGRRGDSLHRRVQRLRWITAEVNSYAGDCELAVIEAPAFSRQGGSTWDRAGLWWRLVDRLLHHDIPVIAVAPPTRAKFATGKGNADKAGVALAAARMWPEWTPTYQNHTNDEADALILASMGLVLADHVPPFPMSTYRTEAIAKLELPESEAA